MKKVLILLCATAIHFLHGYNGSRSTTFYSEDDLSRIENYTISSTQEILELLDEHNIYFLDFIFTDILGNRKMITRTIKTVVSDLTQGLSTDGSSLPGCTRIVNSDLIVKPDISTLKIVSGQYGVKKALVFCDIYKNHTEPYEGCSRSLLKKIIKEVQQMGFNPMVGPELEFYVFKKTLDKCLDQKTYCDSLDNNTESLLKVFLHQLSAHGIIPAGTHHEVGSGQYEISLIYDNPLIIADAIVNAMHIIKTVAHSGNLDVTFMPKPIQYASGNGMHIHFSLFNSDLSQNLFYDNSSANKLSDLANFFIAGILNRANEATPIYNSSINSFKRLVPGYEAPIYICCGLKNRSALIRIPETPRDNPLAVRAELRSPDATSNPYLLFATLLKAGMEGIKNKEDQYPLIQENLYEIEDFAQLRNNNITLLPTTLHDALNGFEESDFMHQCLGDHIFYAYLHLKRNEVFEYNRAVSPWEINRYF